jgi:Tol biopolymer transport system component/DNA-binding winged helix-turn-helix (wHTH) protein
MPDGIFQFGTFELNKRSGELRKNGARIKLQEQPFQILVLLVDRPGEIVDREQIRARLWPEDTFVDFDSAISNAVRRLREALNDSAESPRFIETLARRGYRFIGQIATQAPALPPRKPIRTKPVAIAAGALSVLGFVSWWWRAPHKPNTVSLRPLPLTAASGWENHPSFSPDGNQVAYTWDETGAGNKSHVYVKLIGPGAPVQLTASPNPDFFPAWSPDGRQIAFIRRSGNAGAIYLIPPVGGTERKLADGHFYGPAYWSPDSRFLAFGDRTSADASSLYLINLENGERSRLTEPSRTTMDQGPVISPDGRALLFARCNVTFACSLYLLDLSPGYRPKAPPRLLKDETGDIRGDAWTTDGKDIVYVISNEAGLNYHLMRISIQAPSLSERLSYTGEQLRFGVAIASRGNRLAYVQNFFDRDIWQVRAGESPRSFVASTRLEFPPQYSPDGKRVVFPSDRSGQMQIWVCDAHGANLVQLTNFEELSGTPHWSPDGRWIAFDRQMKQGWRIFVMASDGGQARPLTTDRGDEVIPSWSRNGNWIYYSSNRTGRFEIWRVPANGGKGTQVTQNGGWAVSESVDRDILYFTKNLGDEDYSDLWSRPVAGGEERIVLRSIASRAFIVAEDGIFYVPIPAADGSSSIQFYDFTARKSHQIAAIKDFVGGLTLSSDRKTFLFCVKSRSGSNIMIVDNFR